MNLNKFAAIVIQFDLCILLLSGIITIFLLLNSILVSLYDFISIHCHEVWIPGIFFLLFHQISFMFVNFDELFSLNDSVSVSCDIFITMS